MAKLYFLIISYYRRHLFRTYENSTELDSKLLMRMLPPFYPYLVMLRPWPLTFWAQNLISSSLSEVYKRCKLVKLSRALFETSNVTGRHRGRKRKLRAGYRVTSLKRSHVATRCHRRVWYRMLSLRYSCIQSSAVILIPQANFVTNLVSFVASIAELVHREKSRTQSLSLFDALGTEAFLFTNWQTDGQMDGHLENIISPTSYGRAGIKTKWLDRKTKCVTT